MALRTLLIFLLIWLSLNFSRVSAQTELLKDISSTQQLSEEVVVLFTRNLVVPAFKRMLAHWPLPANEIDYLQEKTIKQLNLVDQRYGQPIGYEKVKTETISDFVIRETYLIRYEYTALRFKFTYYRNNDGWLLHGFRWDDSLSEELD